MENTDTTMVYAMPRIGDQAPDFKAKTTKRDIQMSEFAKDK
jgi:peroxiredoxin (alkyl hydroperoxide reductase subunit C)